MAKKHESTGIAYVILGIVAIMAIVGLVLLFKSQATAQITQNTPFDPNPSSLESLEYCLDVEEQTGSVPRACEDMVRLYHIRNG